MALPALALAIGLVTTGATPELLIIPPTPKGVSSKAAMDAFEAVVTQFAAAETEMGISLTLQSEAREALVGPGRQQARDCGLKSACLAELGSTLGAHFLVVGVLTKTELSLVLLDVLQAKNVSGAKSSRRLKRSRAARKGGAAARGLISDFKARSLGGFAAMRAKEAAKPETPAPTPTPTTTPTPTPQTPSVAMMDDIKPDGINGVIRIRADQLTDVVSVSVDGDPVPRRKDGSIAWIGAPGDHSVIARRNDGARFSKEIFVQPQAIAQVDLVWDETTTPDFTGGFTFEEEEQDESPLTKWWFWTGVGAVVLAGGVTSLALLGGDKGGPSIAGDFGSISGTY